MRSLCAVTSLVVMLVTKGNQIVITLRKLKDASRNTSKKEYGYDLSKTLDEIRPTYRFNETCQDTVPQAIVAFLESTDFEDAIRNAISLGGDSDTLAAITGSIAEAAYGFLSGFRTRFIPI